MDDERSVIEGSAPIHPATAGKAANVPEEQSLRATIFLRPKTGAEEISEQLLSGTFKTLSREEAAEHLGADAQDIAAVTVFVTQYGLQIVTEDRATRTLQVTGSACQFNNAFCIQLESLGDYHSYQGPLTVPKSLTGVIVAVLGLDSRPMARPHARPVQ